MATMEVTGVGNVTPRELPPSQNFCDAKTVTEPAAGGVAKRAAARGPGVPPPRNRGGVSPRRVPRAFAGLLDSRAQRPGRPQVPVS